MINQPGLRKFCLSSLLLSCLCTASLALSATCASGQEVIWPPSQATPSVDAADTITPLTLEDCIQTGLENQPALRAEYASLASARAARKALQNMRVVGLLSREIPIRRQQACFGTLVAGGGVSKVEWETIYAVTRNFFSVQYAQRQEAVARKVVDDLTKSLEKAKFLIKLGDPDVKVTQVDADKLSVYIDLVKVRVIEAAQGTERAMAALREAMGLEAGCPLYLVDADLPPLQEVPCQEQLVSWALARKGQMIQAINAAEMVRLEVSAQRVMNTFNARTFAAAADIHATAVPQGVSNEEYRPWAVGIDMPTTLVGHKRDRVRRAQELHARAIAVVDKTRQLIGLEVADAYLKWEQAAKQLNTLTKTPDTTAKLLKTIKARFDLGKISGEDLIEAQVLDAQVRASQNDALYNHALALAALERITAGGFVPNYRMSTVQPHP